MIKTIKSLIFLGSIILLLTACQKEQFETKVDLGLNYYPLKLNAVSIYDMDSTTYNEFNNSTKNYIFQLKDSVTNQFVDAVGDTSYRIERYKKTNNTWDFQKIILRKITHNRAEEVIDNHRYVRMVFPQQKGISWNGNLYNDMDEWRYRFTAINESKQINNLTIDSTITIEQSNEINLIREDIYYETYAKNIGLVEKTTKTVSKNINTGRIESGYSFKMTLNNYR